MNPIMIRGGLGVLVIASPEEPLQVRGPGSAGMTLIDQTDFLHHNPGPWRWRMLGQADWHPAIPLQCDYRESRAPFPDASGPLILPAGRTLFLLPGDIADPTMTHQQVEAYLSSCPELSALNQGLLHLMKMLHSLGGADAKTLLTGLLVREPSIYELVTRRLFGLISLPLLSKREIFEFMAQADDFALAQAWNSLDSRIRVPMEEGLSARRRERIARESAKTKGAGSLLGLEVQFRQFLETRFARFFDQGPEDEPVIFAPPATVTHENSGIAALIVHEVITSESLVAGNRISGYGLADGSMLVFLEARAEMISVHRKDSTLLFRNFPAGGYMIIPGGPNDRAEMAVWDGFRHQEMTLGLRKG